MRARRTITTTLVLLLTATLPFVTVSPYGGGGGGGGGITTVVEKVKVEGEDFDSADPACSPDFDGQTTHVAPFAGASGGLVAFLPHSGCGIRFQSVDFGDKGGKITGLRAYVDGYKLPALLVDPLNNLPPLLVEVHLYIGSQMVAESGRLVVPLSGATEGIDLSILPSAKSIAGGTHPVRVEYKVWVGAMWVDLLFDFFEYERRLQFGGGTDDISQVGGDDDSGGVGLLECLDELPTITAGLANLIGDGLSLAPRLGWTGLPYDFVAIVQDPEGDVQQVRWLWSDGLESSGTSVTRAFDVSGLLSVVISVHADSTPRCLDLGTEVTVNQAIQFNLLDGLLPTITNLLPRLSCHAGQLLPAWRDFDIIAGACDVLTTVGPASFPSALVQPARVRVDGRDIGAATAGRFAYQSAQVPDGHHTLDTCVSARGDVHGRVFCSEPYAYKDIDCTNQAPLTGLVSGDGMLEGLHGWVNRNYTFTAPGTRDSDGDPVALRWLLPNGQGLAGDVIDVGFSDAADQTLRLVVTDDPLARCPDLFARSTEGQTVFETVPDWIVRLDEPLVRQSCIAGNFVATPALAPNALAGNCRIKGHVVEVVGELLSLTRGRFLVDDDVIHTSTATQLLATYKSAEHGLGNHILTACYRAHGDKYEREFCSDPYLFLNGGAD